MTWGTSPLYAMESVETTNNSHNLIVMIRLLSFSLRALAFVGSSLSVYPLCPLCLRGELTCRNTHNRGTEDTEEAQRFVWMQSNCEANPKVDANEEII